MPCPSRARHRRRAASPFHRLADRIVVTLGEEREVEGDRRRARPPQQGEGDVGCARVDHDGTTRVNPDDVAQAGLDDLTVDGPVGAVPAGAPHLPAQDADEGRLVELEHDLRPGDTPSDLLQVEAQSLGQRAGEVPARAGVGEGDLAVAQFQRGGQRPGTDGLHLQLPLVPLGELLQRVEVFPQPGPRPLGVPPGPVPDPPPAGLHARVQLDEHSGGTADHVGAGAPGGQFGQEREVLEGAGGGPGGLTGVAAGEGADAGGGGEAKVCGHV